MIVMAKRSNSGKVQYGEPVGVVTAQSLGERSTQMVLRTFHQAGVSSEVISAGLPRLIEIVDARKRAKHALMTIRFDKGIAKDYERVKEIKQKLEEVSINTLINGFDENLKNGTMVLHFDKDAMSAHSITLRKVMEMLSSRFPDIEVSNEGNEVTIRYKKRKDVRGVRTAFVHVRDEIVSGVEGIQKAVINSEGETFYIAVSGSNLKGVMDIEGVRPENIYTNDIFEVLSVFGIEAARNAIANEIAYVFDIEKASMNFKHIALLADTMTYSGTIKSVGRHGVAGDKESVFARAAYEETIKHFVNAGFFSETDRLRGVAENIIIGRQITVGTGKVKLMIKNEELERFKPEDGEKE